MGTLFYAPPEQLANRQAMKEKRGAIPNKITPKVRVIGVVERKADIFSVGLMLYEMLLPPMRTISEKSIRFEEARVGKLGASIKGTIYEKMILHCLEVEMHVRIHCRRIRRNVRLWIRRWST